MKRNRTLEALHPSYLFQTIAKYKRDFLAKNPDAKIISLGVGDTTEPITPYVAKALEEAARKLGTKEGYSGYGSEQGITAFREKIASRIYNKQVKPNEVFISDGAKCDIARLQVLFGREVSVAVQEPAYPVYVDGSLLQGVKKLTFLPCVPENDFFPKFEGIFDLIYFCSPSNPTGATATREQLKRLVDFAKKTKAIIIYDAAYASYIQDPGLPKTIYEIEGAKEVAIEVGSYSKLAGFTGIRLGWSVVPEELKYEDGSSVHADWNRVTATIFNGASNIAQAGGIAVLEVQGWKETQELTKHYLENAEILREALKQHGFEIFGGVNNPYLWVRIPGRTSVQSLEYFLNKYQILTTPGSGFGPSGEGFIRFSSYGKRENILEAKRRLQS